jgi:hypothetical protein
VKNKEDGVKLMGFGHRVYKNYDPRAKIIKKTADEVLAKLGKRRPAARHRMELEEIALADDYFVERKLYPNVDFYTGLIYKAMGFPTEMFTVLFALGRLPGWIAQWREMIDDPARRSAARARSTPATSTLPAGSTPAITSVDADLGRHRLGHRRALSPVSSTGSSGRARAARRRASALVGLDRRPRPAAPAPPSRTSTRPSRGRRAGTSPAAQSRPTTARVPRPRAADAETPAVAGTR